ncbi:MAG: flagellar biosynthetic protein FliR [Gammaproteobacteria bacterium]|nr:flagellar biosynthetic protein FliR [Gammaproteobacteria bacterium]
MNYDLVSIITESGYIIIPFTRLSAFFIAAPIFALSAFNLQLKILFALVTTLLIWNPAMVPATLELSSLVKILLFEAGLGAGLGLSLQAVSAGVAVAGQALSNSMGLGMANLVDPTLGNSPILAQFLVILSNFIFLTIDGHLLLIELLTTSFQSVPVGFSIASFDFYGALLSVTGLIFVAGLAISLPLLLVILVINIALGVTTRSAPSLNVISIGFPFILIVGMLGLLLALPTIVTTIEGVWQTVFEFMVL